MLSSEDLYTAAVSHMHPLAGYSMSMPERTDQALHYEKMAIYPLLLHLVLCFADGGQSVRGRSLAGQP